MNTLKNVLFFGLLLAVLCGVYLSLNRSPEPTLPPGLSGDTTPANVVMPDVAGATVSNIPSGQQPGGPPNLPLQPPTVFIPPVDSGGVAPPFAPPATADRRSNPPGQFMGNTSLSPPVLPAPPAQTPNSYPPGVQQPSGSGNQLTSFSNDPPPVALPPPPDRSASAKIEQTMQEVKLDVEKSQFDKALVNLSLLYGSPELSPSQAQRVTELLDEMAAKVIYSREHLLDNDAYLVQAGDTLDSIADQYRVPALLLAKINGIRDPQNLPPGKQLKVLKGPFSAQISTERSEMTLMLDGRYAGRFSVALSRDLSHAQSLWWVRQKHSPERVAGSASGLPWIELSNASGSIFMQATNDAQVTTVHDGNNSHTIWLNQQDMDDVFAILSARSTVIIQQR